MGKLQLSPTKHVILLATLAAGIPAAAADETASRLERATSVMNTLLESAHGIPPEKLSAADCVAVIPGFKKGAAVVGVGYGRGFLMCRKGGGWSAPGAITLEGGSLGIQFGGEQMDIVMLSMDKQHRDRLLDERFVIGSDASAAWGNGKSAHEDANAKYVFYGLTKGAFAGFGLDGTVLKADHSGNMSLYGKSITNNEVIDGDQTTPDAASALIAAVGR